MTDSAERKLIDAVRRGNFYDVVKYYERATGTKVPRGRFPYNVGDALYMRTPEWHFLGVLKEIDIEARWVTLFPVVHILDIENPKDFYTKGLRHQRDGGEDEFELGPEPVTLELTNWICTPYFMSIPVPDYQLEYEKIKEARGGR